MSLNDINSLSHSFTKPYSEEARTYVVSSNNKAFQPNMGGYSIYGSSLDGKDRCVRLEGYMAAEHGGEKGWKIERCYTKEEGRDIIGIAIALLGSPEFLILDEPVNGLDPEGIAEIRTLILKLNQERGITILISSHLLEELSKVVTCYGIIKEGKLVEEFSAKQLELKAKKKLYIKVDDIDKSIELLKKEYRDIVIETNENELVISDYIEESGEINRLLSKNSILVTSLQVKSNGLEQYFLEKVGGKNEESTKI